MGSPDEIVVCYDNVGKCPHCDRNNSNWSWNRDRDSIPNCYCVATTYCPYCDKVIIFIRKLFEGKADEKMVYPISVVIQPHEYLKKYDKSLKFFLEARNIAVASPRSGVALARVSIEAFVNQLGEEREIDFKDKNGKDINFHAKMDRLVKEGIIAGNLSEALKKLKKKGDGAAHPDKNLDSLQANAIDIEDSDSIQSNVIDIENEFNTDDVIKYLECLNAILSHIALLAYAKEL